MKACPHNLSWEVECNPKDYNTSDLKSNFKTTFHTQPEKRALKIGQLVKLGLPKLHDSISLWF